VQLVLLGIRAVSFCVCVTEVPFPVDCVGGTHFGGSRSRS